MNLQSNFKNKICVVTGAGSGIGRSLTVKLIKLGAYVYAFDIEEASLLNLRQEVNNSDYLFTSVLDVSAYNEIKKSVNEIIDQHNRIDFLFNNAGVTLVCETHEVTHTQWKRLFDINIRGVLNGIQTVYPIMIDQNKGAIINISSTAAHTGYTTAAHYAASKAAVANLSEALHHEAKSHNIDVHTVFPGYVDTKLFSNESIPHADKTKLLSHLPFPSVTPSQVAEAILIGITKKKKEIFYPLTAKLYSLIGKAFPSLLEHTHDSLLTTYLNSKNTEESTAGRTRTGMN